MSAIHQEKLKLYALILSIPQKKFFAQRLIQDCDIPDGSTSLAFNQYSLTAEDGRNPLQLVPCTQLTWIGNTLVMKLPPDFNEDLS